MILNQLIQNLNLSYKSKRFIREIISIDSNLELNLQKETIIDIENRILSSDLKEENRTIPLIGTAIGKKSIEYWSDIRNKSWNYIKQKLNMVVKSDIWKDDAIGGMKSICEVFENNDFDANVLTPTILKVSLEASISSAEAFIRNPPKK